MGGDYCNPNEVPEVALTKDGDQYAQVPRGSMYPLGIWVIVIIVQVLGKYMIIGYLDPLGICQIQSSFHFLFRYSIHNPNVPK